MDNPFTGIAGKSKPEPGHVPAELFKRILPDPRPDLKDDSAAWAEVLTATLPRSLELACILHGFRCQGCRLLQQRTHYKIVPVIGAHGWRNREDYQRYADKYLADHKALLLEVLRVPEKPVPNLPPGAAAETSPWPGVTGQYIYVVDGEDARRQLLGAAPDVWVFSARELSLIKRERNPINCLLWRGNSGRYFTEAEYGQYKEARDATET